MEKEYAICNIDGDLLARVRHNHRGFLTFQDKKRADEFLKCFRDLIEKAGDLI